MSVSVENFHLAIREALAVLHTFLMHYSCIIGTGKLRRFLNNYFFLFLFVLGVN